MRTRRTLRTFSAIVLVLRAWAVCAPTQSLAQERPAPPPGSAGVAYTLPDVVTRAWVGDLDGMIQRRQLRILTAYSKTYYFVNRAVQRGVAYDIGQLLETDLNTRLKAKDRVRVLIVPVPGDTLIPALLEGRGDVAMANLTITPARLAQVDFTNPLLRNVTEILVTGPGTAPIGSVQELSGQDVYLRKSSSFYESIQRLNAEFARAGRPPVRVRFAPETLGIEDILEMVNAGLVKATIVDRHMAQFWAQIFPRLTLHPDVAVRTGGEIGWMLRKDSPQLKAALNALLARYPEGSAQRNLIFQKYLKDTKWAKAATAETELAKFERVVALFRKYGFRYNLDYLLMVAQGYQESQLNQALKSPAGAIGVMQLLPTTGQQMGVGDIRQLEANIHAGVKYMRFMMDQFYANEPMDWLDKGLFTFAAYNAGPGRIQELRGLAAKRGLDPNKWFNNVELVVAEKVGQETVTYVGNIYKYYLAYEMIIEQRQERAQARDTIWRGESM